MRATPTPTSPASVAGRRYVAPTPSTCWPTLAVRRGCERLRHSLFCSLDDQAGIVMGIDRGYRPGLTEDGGDALAVDPQHKARIALVVDRLRQAGDRCGIGLRLGQPLGSLGMSDLQRAVCLLVGALSEFLRVGTSVGHRLIGLLAGGQYCVERVDGRCGQARLHINPRHFDTDTHTRSVQL